MIAIPIIVSFVFFVLFAVTTVQASNITQRGGRVNHSAVMAKLYLYSGLTAFTWLIWAVLS